MGSSNDRRTSDAWFELAASSKEAADRLTLDHPRSFISRLYYAMFAQAHALLLHEGLTPRSGMGTWSHEMLPGLIRRHLPGRDGDRDRHTLSRALRRGYQRRLLADYNPAISVTKEEAVAQLRDVSVLLEIQKSD